MKKVKQVNKNKTGFKAWFNDKMMPAMTRFASQKHLTAIRDSFGILTPIIIGGSISFLLGILLFGAGGTLETSLLGLIAKAAGKVDASSGSWKITGGWAVTNQVGGKIFSTIFDFSLGTFSLMIAIMLGYVYASKRDLKSPMFVAVFNLVVFLITAATFRSEQARFNYFYDSKGMLAAILQTFLVIELYRIFANNKKLLIKMPKQVPPMVATGFSLMIPVALVLIFVSTINTGCWAISNYAHLKITDAKGNVILSSGEYGFIGLFYKGVSAPFSAIISGNNVGLGFGLLYQFLIGFFWFFGLNGSSVINGAFYPFLLQMFTQNAEAVASVGYQAASSQDLLGVVNIQFLESYSQTTGWGHTGALLVAIFIFGRVKEHKEVAKLAAVPSLFSINEPVTFGIPVMLHPIYGVGAMFVMPITTFIAWLFVGPLGWVNKSYIMVPWTLPPGIGALLSTGLDWRALLLSWFCLVVAFAWYIPFVLVANKYHYNLNLKRYMDEGLSRALAIAQVKKDDADYLLELQALRAAKKTARAQLQIQKEHLKSLPHEEQKTKQQQQKLLKAQQKSLTKLVQQNFISTSVNKTLTVEVVAYGGYKIKINNKTIATALNEQKMAEIAQKIARANKIKEYTVINQHQIIKTVAVGDK